MSSRLVMTNLSRNYDYTLVLNGSDATEVAPLKAVTIAIEPGEYDVSFKAKEVDDLPSTCKPIHISIEDDKTLQLQVETKHVAIGIYDEHGVLLNGRRGFICGHVSDGIYVSNPIE